MGQPVNESKWSIGMGWSSVSHFWGVLVTIVNLTIPGQFCAGLGDAVMWSWIGQANKDVSFIAGGGVREVLEMFGQRFSDVQPGVINPSTAYDRELQDVGRQSRIHYVCRHLGIPVAASRPQFDPQVDINPKRIALCPHTNYKSRQWPTSYWLDLNWKLRDAGYEPIFQMGHDDPLLSGRGPSMSWWGGAIVDVARRLASCALVVGNDSMPAHMAGTLGRPTLALMGPTKPTVFAHIPEVKCLQATDMHCTGCHFQPPFRVACDFMCESLARLSPQAVLDEIKKAVPL